MNKQSTPKTLFGLLALSLFGMTSCVDNDYDLSKDVDMTVTVGGDELTIPSSNTDTITLARIFDLDPESTVKADQDGNYSLVQAGNGSDTQVSIEEVLIEKSEINVTPAESELNFHGTSGQLEAEVSGNASFDIDKTNVTKDVTELYESDVNMPASLKMSVKGSQGITLNAGFTVTFPEYMTVTTTDQECTVEKNHILKFNKDKSVPGNSSLDIPVNITHINFRNLEGQGLTEPGHLQLKDNVVISGTSTTTSNPGAALTMTTDFAITQIELTEVKAEVDPEINVTIDPITINNLPDFLKDEQVSINMTDPKIFLTVSNDSPIDVNFKGTLKSYKGQTAFAFVQVGEAPAIVIPANSINYVICLHRQEGNVSGADKSITVEKLNDLIASIPDEIRMENIETTAAKKEYTLQLGSTYNVKTDYEINAPLQFNEGTTIVYTDSIDDWNEDVKDLYIKELILTADAINTIPLEMEMTVKAFDLNGNVLEDITTKVSDNIKAGALNDPQTTPLTITLTSTNAEAFKQLNGLRYEVNAKSTPETTGQNLNEGQTLKLDNMIFKVKGGVTIDLN